MVVKLLPREECEDGAVMPQIGSKYCVSIQPLTSPLGAPCTAPPWSTLAAVDLESGETLWQKPFGTLENLAPWPISMMKGGVEMGGPTVTASGLVFIAASFDGMFRAFDVANGEELWSDELPTSGNAVPMTYVSHGRQYVVIAAGGNQRMGKPLGDTLVAFALPR
jgi:glucose dehydrogenase